MGVVATARTVLMYRKRAVEQQYTDDEGENVLLHSIYLSVYVI